MSALSGRQEPRQHAPAPLFLTCHVAAVIALTFALSGALFTLVAQASTYTQSSTPFKWIDTKGHTVLNTWPGGLGCPDTGGDDSLSNLVDIGFVFRFGTTDYKQLRINSNGRLQFNNTRCNFGTQTVGPPRTYPDVMPNAVLDRTISLYVVDEDNSSAGGGTITFATVGTAPNRVFVATWTNVPQWSAVGSSYNMQVQLEEGGDFVLMYGTSIDMTLPNRQAIGPGQLGYELSTADLLIQSGLPPDNTGIRYSIPSAATSLKVTYAADGIYCLDKLVTITVVDAKGNPITGYAGTINLTTTTSRGTWLLSSGAGTLTDSTPDDGAASYVWNAKESSVSLLLRYRAGPTTTAVNAVDASISSIKDDGTQGSITFMPDGFTVTSSALSSPPPNPIPVFASPQTAGTNFPIFITAYGQTPTDATCSVITTYTGAKSLKFWSAYVNPASGTLAPTINAVTIASSEGSAAAQSVTFASGKASVTAKYKDVGRISIAIKDDTTGSALLPTGIRGTTGNFVARPADLVVSAVTTPALVANPAVTTATGAGFVAAGAPFRVQVQSLDAEGAVTPNFGLESPAEGVRLVASLVLPVGGRNGTANDGAVGNATALTRTAAGTFTGTTLFWDEVGIVRLRPSVADADYLGTGSLTGTLSGNVGRFFPASINLLVGSTVTPACTSFTYMDQPALATQFTLQARNTQGLRTQNYDLGLLGSASVGSIALAAENANSGTDLSARLTGLVGAWTLGQFDVNVSNLKFVRTAAADGPFTQLRLGVQLANVLDGLVVAGADMNPASSNPCSSTSVCLAAALGTATNAVYYGRMALRPGFAAENDPLDVSVFAQFWDGAAFRTLNADACSTYAAASASLTNFTGNLLAGNTAIVGPAGVVALIAGRSSSNAPLRLSAPGVGHEGSVRVTLDVPAWLEYPWSGAGNVDPFAIAIFGHYRGHDRIIYRREVF